MIRNDYTILPLGTRLPNGKTVAKCPICGRPGDVLETDTFVSTEHARIEGWITANGEERGKYPIPRGHCYRPKKQ